ncbi:MAG: dephospho-CoA kinase [Rhizobiales bacterium]|nr:dephospho-CoA kinase [Hyphomicrobiales bacterium]
MIKIGLTGSIASGKSYVLNLFSDLYNIPIFSSDECVKELYKSNDQLKDFVKKHILEKDEELNKTNISEKVFNNKEKLLKLEKFIHPLVKLARDRFIEQEKENNSKIVIVEVPLLFEKNLENDFDFIILVKTSSDLQEKRVLERPNMTAELFSKIKKKQLPNKQKEERSHFVIDNINRDDTIKTIDTIMKNIKMK